MFPGTTEISGDAIFWSYVTENNEHPTLDMTSSNLGCSRGSCTSYSSYSGSNMGQMYRQLRAFGWRFYAKVLASYRDDPPPAQASVMEQWINRSAHTAGKNLVPFFRNYGLIVSDALVDELARLPPWEEDPFGPYPPAPPPGARDPSVGCVSGSGADYDGTGSHTISGRSCQVWAFDSPHGHGFNNLPANYCRNPDGEPDVWCYTTDPEVRWEFCDIPKCHGRLASDSSARSSDKRLTTDEVANSNRLDGQEHVAIDPFSILGSTVVLPLPQQPSLWLVNMLELSASLRTTAPQTSKSELHEIMQGDECDGPGVLDVEIYGNVGARTVCLSLSEPDGAPRKHAFVVLDAGDNERVVAVVRREAS